MKWMLSKTIMLFVILLTASTQGPWCLAYNHSFPKNAKSDFCTNLVDEMCECLEGKEVFSKVQSHTSPIIVGVMVCKAPCRSPESTGAMPPTF